MNNQNDLKISHLFNLPNLNFKTQLNLSIDANAHIKNIISVQCYMFDTSLDAVTGKCNVKGKLGAKIIYLDTDNVYNTLTDETSFSEFVSSNEIISDSKISIYNEQVVPELEYDEKYLKLNLNVHARLYSELDIALAKPEIDNESCIIKSKNIEAISCLEKIENKQTEECNLSLSSRANKILAVTVTPTLQQLECNSGYLTISGTTTIQTIYETDNDGFNEIKISTDTKPFKFETQATLCQPQCIANISLKVNPSKTSFTTELADNQTNLNLTYEIIVSGFIFKKCDLQLIEDIYSTSNQLDTNYSERELLTVSPLSCFKTNIEGELNLTDSSADEIIDSANHSCLITQSYFENGKFVFEGVLTSTIIYSTEQKETKSMLTELPFSFMKDCDNEIALQTLNYDLKPINCKAKIKRGNSISLDYEICVEGYSYSSHKIKMIDSIKQGKELDYGDIAFQIIVAKPNEDLWSFCKRTNTSLEKLEEANKEIPPMFNGGEKVIIYR